MSADFNTSILVEGSHEEFKAFVDFLRRFSKESNAQYQQKHDCFYVGHVTITDPKNNSNRKMTDWCKEEEIAQSIDSMGEKMIIDLTGPGGFSA